MYRLDDQSMRTGPWSAEEYTPFLARLFDDGPDPNQAPPISMSIQQHSVSIRSSRLRLSFNAEEAFYRLGSAAALLIGQRRIAFTIEGGSIHGAYGPLKKISDSIMDLTLEGGAAAKCRPYVSPGNQAVQGCGEGIFRTYGR